jgi:hypothetical protein
MARLYIQLYGLCQTKNKFGQVVFANPTQLRDVIHQLALYVQGLELLGAKSNV